MSVDVTTLALAKNYTNKVALNGVPVKNPRINAAGNWEVFDPATNAYVDTGKDSRGSKITIGANGNWFIDGVDTGKNAVPEEVQSISNNDIQNILNNL